MDEVEKALRKPMRLDPNRPAGEQILEHLRAQGVEVDPVLEAFYKTPIVCRDAKVQPAIREDDADN